MKNLASSSLASLLLVCFTGCTPLDSSKSEQTLESNNIVAENDLPPPTSPQVAARESVLKADITLPQMTVYKSPSCGCCKLWVDHMEKSGFKVSVIETEDLNPIKRELGIPGGLGTCHTAKVGGYFVEGHVPASDVIRLLKEKPDALGIGVPGMPLGSPGMEAPSGEIQSYTVTLVNKDGSLSIFSSHTK